MRTGKYDNEILVSHRPAPSCITARDIIKAIDMARHQMPLHYAPALDAAQRLFRLATPEQLQAARIAKDERPDILDALERLVSQIPRPNLNDPDLDAAIEFAERAIAAQRKARDGD